MSVFLVEKTDREICYLLFKSFPCRLLSSLSGSCGKKINKGYTHEKLQESTAVGMIFQKVIEV